MANRNPFARLTKQQQIKALEKSIANPKTPKQFLPSMRARLAKLRG